MRCARTAIVIAVHADAAMVYNANTSKNQLWLAASAMQFSVAALSRKTSGAQAKAPF
jgi:hypothetical protein